MKTGLTVAATIACTLAAVTLLLVSPWGKVALGMGAPLLHHTDDVRNVPSPDGKFEAYMVEEPSIDPPNQSLYVQHSDKTRFMFIAKLAEDLDFIQDVVWSPDSGIVIFRSRYYLTAVRISDWTTTRIYLGGEWVRSRPTRFSTLSTPSPREVEPVEFPENNAFSYRLRGETIPHMVRFPD